MGKIKIVDKKDVDVLELKINGDKTYKEENVKVVIIENDEKKQGYVVCKGNQKIGIVKGNKFLFEEAYKEKLKEVLGKKYETFGLDSNNIEVDILSAIADKKEEEKEEKVEDKKAKKEEEKEEKVEDKKAEKEEVKEEKVEDKKAKKEEEKEEKVEDKKVEKEEEKEEKVEDKKAEKEEKEEKVEDKKSKKEEEKVEKVEDKKAKKEKVEEKNEEPEVTEIDGIEFVEIEENNDTNNDDVVIVELDEDDDDIVEIETIEEKIEEPEKLETNLDSNDGIILAEEASKENLEDKIKDLEKALVGLKDVIGYLTNELTKLNNELKK